MSNSKISKAQEAAQAISTTLIQEFDKLLGFTANKSAIHKAMQNDPALSLADAYLQVSTAAGADRLSNGYSVKTQRVTSRRPAPKALTRDQYDRLYGDVCDAVCRELLGIPDDDPYHHTSDVSRAVANRVMGVLEKRRLIR